MNNKILFWQTSDWYDYNLAYSLQENDLRLYAIIDTVKKPKEFFLNQKFVNYEKFWFYHDAIKKNKKYSLKYLEKFETKYNLNLWLLAYNERNFYEFNKFYTNNKIFSEDIKEDLKLHRLYIVENFYQTIIKVFNCLGIEPVSEM